MTAKKRDVLPDEHYLREAQGPSGCHADTDEARAACGRLVEVGLVYEGPYRNLSGSPVYFGVERHWEDEATL